MKEFWCRFRGEKAGEWIEASTAFEARQKFAARRGIISTARVIATETKPGL